MGGMTTDGSLCSTRQRYLRRRRGVNVGFFRGFLLLIFLLLYFHNLHLVEIRSRRARRRLSNDRLVYLRVLCHATVNSDQGGGFKMGTIFLKRSGGKRDGIKLKAKNGNIRTWHYVRYRRRQCAVTCLSLHGYQT